MLIMAALGGAGTLFGPLLGAIILVPLEQATNAAFGGSGTGITYVVYGAIIMLIARFLPGGLLDLRPRAASPCCLRRTASCGISAGCARWTERASRSRRARSSG